jgi:hypothetical protein
MRRPILTLVIAVALIECVRRTLATRSPKTMNETQIKPVVPNDADDAEARELEERLREEARRYEHDLRELAQT